MFFCHYCRILQHFVCLCAILLREMPPRLANLTLRNVQCEEADTTLRVVTSVPINSARYHDMESPAAIGSVKEQTNLSQSVRTSSPQCTALLPAQYVWYDRISLQPFPTQPTHSAPGHLPFSAPGHVPFLVPENLTFSM